MSWWNDFVNGVYDILGPGGNAPSNPVGNWINSISGNIASGIEGGVVAFLKDIWDVILGPVEIITGVVLILIAIGIALRNDVIGVLPRPAL